MLALFVLVSFMMSACGGSDKDCEGDDCGEATSCITNAECPEGRYCDDFLCIPDPCTEDLCERGVCERGSSECVSKRFCEEESAESDCIEGEYCILGNCMNEETYCESNPCARGVCSFEERACVSATDCEGDSNNCLEGEFCNSDNECAVDPCLEDNIVCEDGGVCDPNTSECVEPGSCNNSDDCLDGSTCVFMKDRSENVCLPDSKICGNGSGDSGCSGNQRCRYDSDLMTAECLEADTCTNALDCLDDRTCSSEGCEEASACEADDFEPNDEIDEATSLLEEAPDGALRATLCQDDTDYYALDLVALAEGEEDGGLLLSLQANPRDVGIGEVELELLDPDGESLFDGTTAPMGVDRTIESLIDLDTIKEGDYLVKVKATDDMQVSGVNYSLSVSFASREIQEACLGATTIEINGDTLSGDTRDSESNVLGSTCTNTQNSAPEVVYSFEVTERSAVSVMVISRDTNSKLSASIRKTCSVDSSEVACQEDVEDGRNPLSPSLEPGIYYLIVQARDGSEGGAFNVSLASVPVACTPADDACVDEDTVQICNPSTNQIDTKDCLNGCDPDIVECRRVPGDLCVQAVEEDEPFSTTFNWSDYRNDLEVEPGGCVPTEDSHGDTETDGPDAVWKVTIPPNKALDATLTMADSEQGSIYVLDSCANTTSACLDGQNSGNQRDQHVGWVNNSEDPLEVYLVADRSAHGSMGDATLNVDFVDVVCDPEDAAYCNADDDIEKCNKWGTGYEVTRPCNFGCDDDGQAECSPPTNDSCAEPLEVESGVQIVAEMDDYSNQHDTTCFNSSSTSTAVRGNGSDAVYKITTTKPHTIVRAEMFSSFDGVLYAADHCPSGTVNECGDYADSVSSNGTETIEFEAEDPGEYFIFADAYFSSSSSGVFTLEVTLDEPSCTPGEILGCDGSAVEKCDSKGFPQTSTCRDTCVDGACYIAPGDTCDDPLTIASGETVTGDLGDFYPDYNLPSDSCTGKATRGADVVYALETTADNQIVELNLDADFNASLYVSRDCVSTGDAPSCVAGVDENASGEGEDLTFLAVDKGTYFIYIDSSISTASGDYSLTADVRAPSCSPGEILGCSGDTLSYCNSLGDPTDYDCAGGCENGVCAEPSGDVCHDPIVLAHGETVVDAVNTDGRTDSVRLGSGVNNQCIVGPSSTKGAENIYQVDLLAGELLTVNIDSDSSALVSYISRSCVSAAQSCQAIDSNGEEGRLQYFAQEDESVFVMIDATDTIKHDYSLTVEVDDGFECLPGGFHCVDDDTLEVCSRDGREVLGEYNCPEGCAAGACEGIDSPSECTDSHSIGGINAPNIGTGISVRGKFSDLSNSVSMPSSGCTEIAGSGPDMMFAVDLSPGDVLEGRVSSANGEEPSVYVLSDCGEASSCLVGSGPEESLNVAEEAYVRYLAEDSETVYIVADSRSSSARGAFSFDVNVSLAECGSSDTSCIDSKTEQYCNQGLFDEHRCYYGDCSGGATGSCQGTAPDVCADAMLIPNDGDEHVFRGLIQDLSSAIDLDDAASHSPCYEDAKTPGPEAFYAVDMDVGEILRLTYNSPGDPVLWVANNCDNMTNRCFEVAEADSSDPHSATMEFVASTGGTYYIVADNKDANTPDGEYRLEAQVLEPECVPYDTECVDEFTMRQCSRNGVWSEMSCYYGCEADQCASARGDTCQDAVEVPSGYGEYVFNGLMEDFSDESDLASRSESCDGRSRTPGPDVFYQVDLLEGDILHVEWTSSGDGVLWIADDCSSNIHNSCVAAVDSGNPETIDFVAPADGTYYIVGDNYSSLSHSGEFTMEISVTEPECIASTFQQTCLDDTTLEYCNELGLIGERECACENDVCLNGGDTCADAPDITSRAAEAGGVRFAGEYAEFSNNFQGAYCGETSNNTKGEDLVFKLSLEEDEVLSVNVQNTSLAYPAIFLVEDCDDLDANSCAESSPSGFSTSNNMTFTATETKDYYLVIDHDYPSGNPSYDLQIEISESCNPSTFEATCASSTVLEYCGSDSLVTGRFCLCEEDTCLGGGNTCSDAPDITDAASLSGGVTFEGEYADFSNSFSGGYCGASDFKTSGQDFAYLVDLVQGETIKASVESSGAAYPSIFFVESCDDLTGNQCLESAVSSGSSTTGSYTATSSGPIYVVIDHDWPSGGNSYTANFRIE